MQSMHLHLHATDHISVAREAGRAVRHLRKVQKAYSDEGLRKQAEENCRQADLLARRLLAASHVFGDPDGWAKEASRMQRLRPEGGAAEENEISPEEIAWLSAWARSFDQPHRAEMARNLASYSSLCSQSSRDLRARLSIADSLDDPSPFAHIGASPFFPAHYRLRGSGPNGTVRLVKESAGSRTGFFLARNYLRSHRHDTADPHVRAALFVAHSLEDFLLSALGRTEAVLGGKAVTAHHAKLILRSQQARKAGLEEGRLKRDVRSLGDLLRKANPGQYFVHVPGVRGPALPAYSALGRREAERPLVSASREPIRTLPDGRTIDIEPVGPGKA